MDLRLKDKVAIVTGSSKGIGAGIAKAFAKAGAKVVVNYAKNKESATQVVNSITVNGGTAIAIQADISKFTDIQKLFKATNDAFGQLDILVNNAGVFKIELLDVITEESFHLQVNTHLMAPILSIQQAVKMFSANGGSIINISSTVSQNPLPGFMVYSAAKAGIDNVTRVLAKELGPKKIRINVIAPGITETEGNYEMGILGGDTEKQMVPLTPLGRLGQPDDIAKVAVFLASDEAGWITGERITVSGGLL
ncbi:glucose 1-dehydrogenase [Arachidicoccus ginsenosidivorans]|jgi:3-oxoacyl-[acyl-carrier protein] reductase|uniref:Glucose 1-dehydrogenase n=1 Tax=Arachidicoccus ginsenosidivorans TaxID=496057 RepID=A0A5B8VQR9_9BACT|nr:glucose 1-dehydrogenase [Arachidicoccus ginsenosidivorans]QEC73046.1 glucose 1-dehydrogenase [Arachidicoccus ginsenosidivorans]